MGEVPLWVIMEASSSWVDVSPLHVGAIIVTLEQLPREFVHSPVQLQVLVLVNPLLQNPHVNWCVVVNLVVVKMTTSASGSTK